MARVSDCLTEIGEAIFPSNIYCLCCGGMIDRSRPYSICDLCIPKIHWINGDSGQGVCEKCGKALPSTYRGKRCYDCMSRKHWFTKGYSCLTYGLHEREILMDIKYNHKGFMAVKMGDIMFDRMAGELNLLGNVDLFPLYREECYCGSEQGLIIDLIIPVPVSKGRYRKRGYNQSSLMARQFRRRWAREMETATDLSNGVVRPPGCEEHVLFRTKETAMLRSLNPSERNLALTEVFAVKSNTRYRIRNKSILLIDDIYTTGATSDACSRVLLENGAAAVYVLALCSGGNKKPGEN